MEKRTWIKLPGKLFVKLFIAILVIVDIYPIIWMFLNSFRSNKDIYSNPIGFPSAFDFSVFTEAWAKADFGRAFYNSIYIAVFQVTLIVLVSSLAAYSITILNVKGKHLIYTFIVSMQVVSGQIILIPLFGLLKDIGLLNNLWANILTGAALGLPLSTMIFKGGFQSIPMDLYESAVMDGCTDFRFFLKMVFPLAKPTFSSVIIYHALFSWNEYLFALTFLRSAQNRTITTATQVFFTQWQANWTQLFAILCLALIPIFLLYIFMQKYFITGMLAGAVKG
ncbi:MAG: carbohydrate ABC transporter permease [Eubacteriales bacterium]|nr:carbohydrate ABC transporter permease [Eubacteriales bacterium]